MKNNPFFPIHNILVELKNDNAIIGTKQNLEKFNKLLGRVERLSEEYELNKGIDKLPSTEKSNPVIDAIMKVSISKLIQELFEFIKDSP